VTCNVYMYICVYIYFFPLLTTVFIYYTLILTHICIFIIGGFNIHIYIIPYIHGLELIFTDWTDTEDIYIYIYTMVLQKAEETSTTEQKEKGQEDAEGLFCCQTLLENYVLDIFKPPATKL
jgi:hypothetical protein